MLGRVRLRLPHAGAAGDPQEAGVVGYNLIQQQEQHDFYKQWTSSDFPRFLVVEVQHSCPYFDDSYAVNSASLGPWGDAIMYELLPVIEQRFRGIGEGWARFTYGAHQQSSSYTSHVLASTCLLR